jgi:hypothetical protein
MVLLYVWIGEFFGKTFDGHFTWRHWAVAALGAWSAAGGYSFRRKLLARAAAAASGGKEQLANRTWSVAGVGSVGSAHGVVLWGVIGRMVLRSPRWFCYLFYVTGIVLLLIYKPSKPPVPVN